MSTQVAAALAAKCLLIVLISTILAQGQSAGGGPAPLSGANLERICEAIDRVGEIAERLRQDAADLSSSATGAERERMRRQSARARHAHGILVDLKERWPLPVPGSGGGGTGGSGAVPGLMGARLAAVDILKLVMRTPSEVCVPEGFGSFRYYSFSAVSDSEQILVNLAVLDLNLSGLAWGAWSIDALALILVHEVQRLTRSVCYLSRSAGQGGGLPPSPVPPELEYLFQALTEHGQFCLEIELWTRDLELVDELIRIDSLRDPGAGYSAEERKNLEWIRIVAKRNIENLMRLKQQR